MLPGYVVPGQVICPKSDKFLAGVGVEEDGGSFRASLLGKLILEPIGDEEHKQSKINIINSFQNPYADFDGGYKAVNSRRSVSQVPQVDDVVYGEVTRLNKDQVHLEIVAVENCGNMLADSGVGVEASALGSVHCNSAMSSEFNEIGEGYGAVIRIQDIRATERDKIKIYECFRPGDIVRASVLSVGDGQNYYLTTSRSDLGVCFARDPSTGAQLLPADWQTVINSVNGAISPRKCANPFI